MRDKTQELSVPNALTLAGSLFTLACTPRVSATLVMTEPDAREPTAKAKAKPKPKPRPGVDHTPPTIIRAEQLGETLLRLHLSEPIADTSGVDPNDFRISLMHLYIGQRAGYAYASYYDPGYQNYGQPLRFVSAEAHEARLDLQLSRALPLYYCRQFNQYGYDEYALPGTHTDNGMFLHYAAGSIPIRDEAGNALANFGEAWVRQGRSQPPQSRLELSGAAAVAVGKSHLIQIECGPRLPDGPR